MNCYWRKILSRFRNQNYLLIAHVVYEALHVSDAVHNGKHVVFVFRNSLLAIYNNIVAVLDAVTSNACLIHRIADGFYSKESACSIDQAS